MATYKGETIDLTPTEAMAEEAQRFFDWRAEGEQGGTDVAVERARQLVNRQELSPETVRRMHSFFSRHEVDKEAEGFRPGEDGYPSPGRVAWAAWGGDPGQSWARGKAASRSRISCFAPESRGRLAPSRSASASRKVRWRKPMTSPIRTRCVRASALPGSTKSDSRSWVPA